MTVEEPAVRAETAEEEDVPAEEEDVPEGPVPGREAGSGEMRGV